MSAIEAIVPVPMLLQERARLCARDLSNCPALDVPFRMLCRVIWIQSAQSLDSWAEVARLFRTHRACFPHVDWAIPEQWR